MGNNVRHVDILRIFSSGCSKRATDEVLEERFLFIEVDGHEVARGIILHGDEKLWALGHLVGRGIISSMKDIDSINLENDRISVSSAGNGYKGSVDSIFPAFVPRWNVHPSRLTGLVDLLPESPLFSRTGNVHTAILASTGGEALFRAEDLGRHNAFDKAVGWAVNNCVDLSDCFLVMSGRLPSDMVKKAAVSGIPMLVSVSAVTMDAIDMASEAGITLIGFARNGRMNVYTHPERVEQVRIKVSRGQ